MAATKNTIMVWSNNPTRKEGIAASAITPGMIVERTSTADNVQPQSTADVAPAPLLVAEENELEGQEITTAYATGDRVFFRALYPGDVVEILLADGENIAIGDYLTPLTDGTVDKVTSTEVKVFQALEAKDLTATAITAADYILAEVC